MARLTKTQIDQFEYLVSLFHDLVHAKHNNNRALYEEVVACIHETTEVDEDDKK